MLGGLGRTHSESWIEARQVKVVGRYAVRTGKQPGRGPEACGFSRSTNSVLSPECEWTEYDDKWGRGWAISRGQVVRSPEVSTSSLGQCCHWEDSSWFAHRTLLMQWMYYPGVARVPSKEPGPINCFTRKASKLRKLRRWSVPPISQRFITTLKATRGLAAKCA